MQSKIATVNMTILIILFFIIQRFIINIVYIRILGMVKIIYFLYF